MTENPPWADRIIAKHRAAIDDAAHSLGLTGPSSLEELGCGHYGCVLPTDTPNVVFKLTSDETEASFVQTAINLKSQGVDPQGIVRYYGVFSLKDASLKRRPVFCLWREEAFDVGGENWMRPYKGDQYLLTQADIFTNLSTSFRVAAGEIRKLAVNAWKRRRAEYFDWVESQVTEDAMNRGSEIFSEFDIRFDSSKVPTWMDFQEALHQRKYPFGVLVSFCEQIAMLMENENVAYVIGRTLRDYLDAGILLADVHNNNIGHVSRPDENDFPQNMPVITDPGHAVLLRRELASVSIPIIGG